MGSSVVSDLVILSPVYFSVVFTIHHGFVAHIQIAQVGI